MNATVATKLLIPQLDAGLVQRPDLMHRLDAALQNQLTLVAAPAGYGKTTSIAMWLRTLGQQSQPSFPGDPPRVIKSAWYNLDAEDDEFSTFFTRFVAALELAMPGALPTVPVGLAIQGIPAQRYANLLAEACLALPHEVVLVLDDYHLIMTPDIHVALTHLVRYASSRLHLIITSRHTPSLPISRLRAQHLLLEVRADELRLSETEAAALLALRLARSPSHALVAALQARTEGWVVGLQLAAAALGQETEAVFLDNLQRADNLLVLDYLFDEVLAFVPVQMRDFLLKTALVGRFNVALAAQVTGCDVVACRQLLDQLRQRNLFLVALDLEGTWFRYHRQFRAMLVNRAEALLSASTIDAIRSDAVAWLAGHGWFDAAIAECVADEDWQRAADLIEADRHPLQNRQEWHLLWRRITLLPQALIAARPGLLLARAWLLQVFGRYAAMLQVIEQAASLLDDAAPGAYATPPGVMRGEISALRGAWFFPEIPLEQRLVSLQDALSLLTPPLVYGWARGFAFISFAHVMLGLGQGEAAYRQILQEIERVDLGHGEYLVRLHHALTTLIYLGGALEDLEQHGDRYLQVATRQQLPMAAAWARFAIGWSRFQRNESASAFEALLPIFDRPQEIHLQNLTMALAPLVPLAAENGRAGEVAVLLEHIQQIAAERENLGILDEVVALSALATLLAGDRHAALAWATRFMLALEAAALPSATTTYMASAQVYIYAKIVLAAGSATQIEQARQLLHVSFEAAQARGYVLDLVQVEVLLACCDWRTAHITRACEWMRLAIEVGMARGYRRVFFEQGSTLAEVLYSMIQRAVCADKASRLLAEYGAWAGASQRTVRTGDAEPPVGIEILTERETEILVLLAQQMSNKEIAQRLQISTLTVRNHTNNIYGKLNVHSRRQAVMLARSLNILH